MNKKYFTWLMLVTFLAMFVYAAYSFKLPESDPPYVYKWFMSCVAVVTWGLALLVSFLLVFSPQKLFNFINKLKTEEFCTNLFIFGLAASFFGMVLSTVMSMSDVPLRERKDQTCIAMMISVVGVFFVALSSIILSNSPKSTLEISINDNNMRTLNNLQVAEGKYDMNQMMRRAFAVYHCVTKASVTGKIMIFHDDGTTEELDINEIPNL